MPASLRPRNYCASDRSSQRARLCGTRYFDRPSGDVGVDLHDERVLLRDAAAVDDLLDLDAVFFETIDNCQCAEGRSLDKGAVDFSRCCVKSLTEQQASQSLVHEDGAIAVIPIECKQSR